MRTQLPCGDIVAGKKSLRALPIKYTRSLPGRNRQRVIARRLEVLASEGNVIIELAVRLRKMSRPQTVLSWTGLSSYVTCADRETAELWAEDLVAWLRCKAQVHIERRSIE